jgi:hypothetical protein
LILAASITISDEDPDSWKAIDGLSIELMSYCVLFLAAAGILEVLVPD